MSAVDELCRTVRDAPAVVAVGTGTRSAVGGTVVGAVAVRAPSGIVDHQPADMTVRVRAGTTVTELAGGLAEQGQECPLDPADPAGTVGGVLACGLSGPRRLRYGPLRDRVLEVRLVDGTGREVRGGGPTVKNVTGYDLPRLLVGSLGTLGVLTEVTLRAQPRPERSAWHRTDAAPDRLRGRLHRPACLAWDGRTTHVLLEGYATDIDAEARTAELEPGSGPAWPAGPHRGRISVAPARAAALGARLDDLDVGWLAELGVGTLHVAATDEGALGAARAAAHAEGGWLLREAGAPGLDPFGVELPNRALLGRVRAAFDPQGKLSPGRCPW